MGWFDNTMAVRSDTPMSDSTPMGPRRGLVNRLLDIVERVGNRLPDPLTLFVLLAIAVPILSWLAVEAGWTVTLTDADGRTTTYEPVDLLTVEYLRKMFTTAVDNFAGFRPLGVVLVAMIGIGVVERTGLITTLLKLTVTSVPGGLISAALVFAGAMSSLGADVGYVVLTPLGAVLFAGLGRHPLAGLCAAFAGVSGGFSANLLVAAVDPMLSELTNEAAAVLDPSYEGASALAPTCNYYLMASSVVLVTVIGWFVTDKIVEPRLGTWKGGDADDGHAFEPVTARERYAALCAFESFVLVLLLIALLATPAVGVLYDAEFKDDLMKALGPLIKAIVPIMLIAFFVPGLVYGLVTGAIRNDRVVAKMTAETMGTMGVYIVLAFAAAQFIEYFKWSNLGIMIAVEGANVISSLELSGIVLVFAFMFIAAFLNLFIGSASAKWALIAPVFVPMMMLSGFSPELTQAAYRIADSVTNIITPLMPYFPIVVAFGQKYDPNLRLGTLISAMLPYSIALTIGWTVLLAIFWFGGIPLGPGASMEYVPPAAPVVAPQ